MIMAQAPHTNAEQTPRPACAPSSGPATWVRRRLLGCAAARSLLALGAAWGPASASDNANALDSPGRSGKPLSELSRELASRPWRSEALKIDFPPLADSGHSVPFEVVVQSPPGRTLTALDIVLPENPFPLAVRLRLPTPTSRYRFSTRLRLAASQRAWAIATFDDGSQQGASAATVITSSACLDES